MKTNWAGYLNPSVTVGCKFQLLPRMDKFWLSRIRLKQEFYQAFNDTSEHIDMERNKKIIQTNH